MKSALENFLFNLFVCKVCLLGLQRRMREIKRESNSNKLRKSILQTYWQFHQISRVVVPSPSLSLFSFLNFQVCFISSLSLSFCFCCFSYFFLLVWLMLLFCCCFVVVVVFPLVEMFKPRQVPFLL